MFNNNMKKIRIKKNFPKEIAYKIKLSLKLGFSSFKIFS